MDIVRSLDCFLERWGATCSKESAVASYRGSSAVWTSMLTQTAVAKLEGLLASQSESLCPVAARFFLPCTSFAPSVPGVSRLAGLNCMRSPSLSAASSSASPFHPSVTLCTPSDTIGIDAVAQSPIAAGTIVLDESPISALVGVNPSQLLSPHPSHASSLSDGPSHFQNAAPCLHCLAMVWLPAEAAESTSGGGGEGSPSHLSAVTDGGSPRGARVCGGVCAPTRWCAKDVAAQVAAGRCGHGLGGVGVGAGATAEGGAGGAEGCSDRVWPYCSARCASADMDSWGGLCDGEPYMAGGVGDPCGDSGGFDFASIVSLLSRVSRSVSGREVVLSVGVGVKGVVAAAASIRRAVGGRALLQSRGDGGEGGGAPRQMLGGGPPGKVVMGVDVNSASPCPPLPPPLCGADALAATWRPSSTVQWGVCVGVFASVAVACHTVRDLGGVEVFSLGGMGVGEDTNGPGEGKREGGDAGVGHEEGEKERRFVAAVLRSSRSQVVVRTGDHSFIRVAPPMAREGGGGEGVEEGVVLDEECEVEASWVGDEVVVSDGARCAAPAAGTGPSIASSMGRPIGASVVHARTLRPGGTVLPVFVYYGGEWVVVRVDVAATHVGAFCRTSPLGPSAEARKGGEGTPLTTAPTPAIAVLCSGSDTAQTPFLLPTFRTFLWLVSVAATNGTAVGQPLAGQAVYRHHALLNHSCTPSAAIAAHSSTRLRVVALRDIDTGDSITHSHLQAAQSATAPPRAKTAQGSSSHSRSECGIAFPHRTRRRALQAAWGFECACEQCMFEARCTNAAVNSALLLAARVNPNSDACEGVTAGLDLLVPFTSRGPAAAVDDVYVDAMDFVVKASEGSARVRGLEEVGRVIRSVYRGAVAARREAVGAGGGEADASEGGGGGECRVCVLGKECSAGCWTGGGTAFRTSDGASTHAADAAGVTDADAAVAAVARVVSSLSLAPSPATLLLAPSLPIPSPAVVDAAAVRVVMIAAHVGIIPAQLLFGWWCLRGCGGSETPGASSRGADGDQDAAVVRRDVSLAVRWFASAVMGAETTVAAMQAHNEAAGGGEGASFYSEREMGAVRATGAAAKWVLAVGIVRCLNECSEGVDEGVGEAGGGGGGGGGEGQSYALHILKRSRLIRSTAPARAALECWIASASTHCTAAVSTFGHVCVGAASVAALLAHLNVLRAKGGAAAKFVDARPPGKLGGLVNVPRVQMSAIAKLREPLGGLCGDEGGLVAFIANLCAEIAAEGEDQEASEERIESAHAAAVAGAMPSPGADAEEAMRVGAVVGSTVPLSFTQRVMQRCLKDNSITVGGRADVATGVVAQALDGASSSSAFNANVGGGGGVDALAPLSVVTTSGSSKGSLSVKHERRGVFGLLDTYQTSVVLCLIGTALEPADFRADDACSTAVLPPSQCVKLFTFGCRLLELAESQCEAARTTLTLLRSVVP